MWWLLRLSAAVRTTCCAYTMARMGLECTFVSPDCSDEELEAAFRPNTKAVFGETIANPALNVLDIERFANAALMLMVYR